MVVFSLVVSVISFLVLGLLAKLVVSSMARSLCFALDFIWFHRDLPFIRFLVDCGFAGVSCSSLLLNARDYADFAVLSVLPIHVFGNLFSRCSSSSFSRCLSRLCDFTSVSCLLLLLHARDSADFAVLSVFPILTFGTLFSQCSSSSFLRWVSSLYDFSPDDSFRSHGESLPFPKVTTWGSNATNTTPVRSKTITNPTMLDSWHAIPTKASIDAAKHHSFSISFLVNDCSNWVGYSGSCEVGGDKIK